MLDGGLIIYEYKAVLGRVVDADTVVMTIDCGFDIYRHAQPYRLLRINAPEMRFKAGKKSKEALIQFLADKQEFVVQTHKTDVYGRFLAELTVDGINVSDWLVANGHAKYHDYEK